jgi:hypothetical protein
VKGGFALRTALWMICVCMMEAEKAGHHNTVLSAMAVDAPMGADEAQHTSLIGILL